MHVLIAKFTYAMSEAELRATATEIAPGFSAIPGCHEKTWIIDPVTSTAGGVYKFRDLAALRAYLASPLWEGVKSTAQFTDLTTAVFATIEEATIVTHGIPTTALAR